jgi:hypothetical protein
VAKSIKVVALFVLIITARLKQIRSTLGISKKVITNLKLVALRTNHKHQVLIVGVNNLYRDSGKDPIEHVETVTEH